MQISLCLCPHLRITREATYSLIRDQQCMLRDFARRNGDVNACNTAACLGRRQFHFCHGFRRRWIKKDYSNHVKLHVCKCSTTTPFSCEVVQIDGKSISPWNNELTNGGGHCRHRSKPTWRTPRQPWMGLSGSVYAKSNFNIKMPVVHSLLPTATRIQTTMQITKTVFNGWFKESRESLEKFGSLAEGRRHSLAELMAPTAAERNEFFASKALLYSNKFNKDTVWTLWIQFGGHGIPQGRYLWTVAFAELDQVFSCFLQHGAIFSNVSQTSEWSTDSSDISSEQSLSKITLCCRKG